jgi:hypothetical protein
VYKIATGLQRGKRSGRDIAGLADAPTFRVNDLILHCFFQYCDW